MDSKSEDVDPEDGTATEAPYFLSYQEVAGPSDPPGDAAEMVFVVGRVPTARDADPPPTLLGLMSLADLTAWGDPQLLKQEIRDRSPQR